MTIAQSQELEDLDEQIRIVRGRRAPFTQVPDWVGIHPTLSNEAKALYWRLAMHVNVSRGTNTVWPTRKILAKLMQLKQARSIKGYLEELVEAQAIGMELVPYAGGMRRRYVYVVHEVPPKDYPHPVDLDEWYAIQKAEAAAEAEKTAGQDESAVERTSGNADQHTSDGALETHPGPAPKRTLGQARKRALKKEDEGKLDERKPDELKAPAGSRRAVARRDSSRPATPKPPSKTAQLKADRARRAAEADSRKAEARDIAAVWWEYSQETYGPWAGRSGGYMGLVGMIDRALNAGYSTEQIRLALRQCATHLPHAGTWQRTLGVVSGRTSAQPARGSAGRPTAYSDSATWQRDPADRQPTESKPDLTEAEAEALFGSV